VKGIHRSNLDLDIVLSERDINDMQHKSEVIKHERGYHIKHEDPVLESALFDEADKKIGVVRLQQTAEHLLISEYGFESLRSTMDRGVFFIKMGPELWDIKLDWQTYLELRREGSLTRRIPVINSQIWIYNPEHQEKSPVVIETNDIMFSER